MSTLQNACAEIYVNFDQTLQLIVFIFINRHCLSVNEKMFNGKCVVRKPSAWRIYKKRYIIAQKQTVSQRQNANTIQTLFTQHSAGCGYSQLIASFPTKPEKPYTFLLLNDDLLNIPCKQKTILFCMRNEFLFRPAYFSLSTRLPSYQALNIEN